MENGNIESSLILVAEELKKLNLPDKAPPVFLLDSNRTHRYRTDVSTFDNSWDVYGQDFPSADYFLENGIKKIIVRGQKIQKDLKKILYKFQKKGMKILFTKGYAEPKEVSVRKPLLKD